MPKERRKDLSSAPFEEGKRPLCRERKRKEEKRKEELSGQLGKEGK